MQRLKLGVVIATIVFLLAGPGPCAAHASDKVSSRQLRRAVDRLQQWYDPATALWTKGWWTSANSITVLVDTSRVLHTSRYLPMIANTYSHYAPIHFLKNKFYDDEGWWGLAWVDAYDLTHNADYLHMAGTIFTDMTTGWDDTCGGGIWWSKDRKYKNAIANELFLSLAAHLANRTADGAEKDQYAGWAKREWEWFRNSGMIEGDHLISDGLSRCSDNHGTKWTYNQGVILGGLVELSRLPGEGAALDAAVPIADAAIAKLTDTKSILHEPCEPKCGGDGTQFKGIFVRNLLVLNGVRPSADYVKFIDANAASVLKNDQAPDHSLGLVWSGPPDGADAVSQTSAIDVLVAAQALRR